MAIRTFEPRDQEAARGVILEGLGEHFGFIDESLNPDLDDIQASYLSSGQVFLVAEAEGSIVGTAGLLFETPGVARIVRMSVCSPLRRQGIATALLNALTEEAQARSLEALVARTEPHWTDAASFYARSGFEQFAEDEVDIHLRLELRFAVQQRAAAGRPIR